MYQHLNKQNYKIMTVLRPFRWLPTPLLLFVLILMTTSTVSQSQSAITEPISPLVDAEEKIQRSLEMLEEWYIEDIDFKQAAENAIKGMLKELDPHSVYIPADEYTKTQERLKGTFEGIGIQFDVLRDTVLVLQTTPDSPSDKAGIQSGDKIVKIDEEIIAGMNMTTKAIQRKLKGPKGSPIRVGIKRTGYHDILNINMTRTAIPLKSIDAAYMASPTIGYVKINKFAANTLEEFVTSLSRLKKKGMEDLILDLRGNGGGYLRTAIQIADQFLSDDQLVVYTEGKNHPKRPYQATRSGMFEEGRLAILVDEGSASASEIVAGAIQDWDRGVIIGRRSFGKGLVQKPFKMNDKSVIRLTVAYYYTPSGRSIQKPYTEGREAYFNDIANRFDRGEMMSPEYIQLPDSLRYTTKIKKRTVYGGGGIMPDLFVRLDTAAYSSYYRLLKQEGALNDFLLEYLDGKHTQFHKKYANVDEFKTSFEEGTELLEQFLAFVEGEGLAVPENVQEATLGLLNTQLKALIARYLWDTEAYYKIMNEQAGIYVEAVKYLQGEVFTDLGVED